MQPYRQSPEPPEDLLQVGYVGLLKAINNVDPRYGDSLSAYARPCLSGAIKRHFRDRRWQMRVSRRDGRVSFFVGGPDDARRTCANG